MLGSHIKHVLLQAANQGVHFNGKPEIFRLCEGPAHENISERIERKKVHHSPGFEHTAD